jgi:hypothetical protein
MSRKAIKLEPFRPAAQEYVDRQLAVMEKYGSRPNLSEKQYQELVDRIAAIAAQHQRIEGSKQPRTARPSGSA